MQIVFDFMFDPEQLRPESPLCLDFTTFLVKCVNLGSSSERSPMIATEIPEPMEIDGTLLERIAAASTEKISKLPTEDENTKTK